MKTLIREDRFGIYNGIDGLAADPRAFDTLNEAETALRAFKGRFRLQGFYRSSEGYRLLLASLEADGEGGGVFIVRRGDDPEAFDSNFWA
jgi:hypothetical protein